MIPLSGSGGPEFDSRRSPFGWCALFGPMQLLAQMCTRSYDMLADMGLQVLVASNAKINMRAFAGI